MKDVLVGLVTGGSLATEVQRLRDEIRKHRDQRGDDRCWQDDEALYEATLPEGCGDAKDRRLCNPDEMVQNCLKFIASRHDPSQPYTSPQRRIEELEAEVATLEKTLEHMLDMLNRSVEMSIKVQNVVNKIFETQISGSPDESR